MDGVSRMNNMTTLWDQITDEIRGQVNEAAVKMFLTSISPQTIDEGTLVLEAVNDPCRDWIERRFLGVIENILEKNSPHRSL